MATHLCVDRLLHVVRLLDRTATQQAVRHRVVLVRQHRTILHHVRVGFCFQQQAVVTDDHDRLDHVLIVFSRRVLREQLLDLTALFHLFELGQVLAWHQAVVGQQLDLLVLVLLHLLRRLQLRVVVLRGDVDLAVDALLDALNHLVDGDVLLDGHPHAVVDGRAVRVEQEVLRVDWHQLDGHAWLLSHADGHLHGVAWDGLRRRDVLHLLLDDDLADTGAVDFR